MSANTLPPIDLARVGVTDHALSRWRERTGRSPDDLPASLRSAIEPPRQYRVRIWRWLTNHQWHKQNGKVLRYCPLTRVVFLLGRQGRPWDDGSDRWVVVTVTTLDVIAREGGPCRAEGR